MHFLKDLLYPRRCLFCEQVLDIRQEGPLCGKCRIDPYLITGPRYRICSGPVTEEGDLCRACFIHNNQVAGRALFSYDRAVREAVHRFKYEDRTGYAEDFARLIRRYGPKDIPDPAVLVPVPIHKKRLAERGYNQAELLALSMQKEGFGRCLPLLQRVRHTSVQNKLSMQMRRKNIHGAFTVDPQTVLALERDRSLDAAVLVVVDDIYTTGSTVEEAAETLRRALPGWKVRFFTLTMRLNEPQQQISKEKSENSS